MEQSHHLLDLIHSYFPHESADIRTISPLKLAYLGDAVYEIIIRTLIMERTGGPVKNLHKRTRLERAIELCKIGFERLDILL